jgi:peptidoglycan DL-endopeptidase CwlO
MSKDQFYHRKNLEGKMNLKKILIGASVLTAVVVPTASASSLSQAKDKSAQLQAEASHASNQVAKDKQQVNTLQKQVNSYTESINTVQQQVNDNMAQISALNKQLNDLNTQINNTQTQLKKDQDEFMSDVRVMYEDGSARYMDVLFSATTFSDLVDRLQMLSLISKHDKDLADQVKSLEDSLVSQQSSKKSAVADLQKKQSDYQALLITQKNLQNIKKQALSQVSTQLKVDNNHHRLLESQIQLTQQQIAAIEEETKRAEQQGSDPGYVQKTEKSFGQVNVNSLVSYAERFIGLPYIWGGTTPNPGFDCSGYTQYVFSHFGVQINRTAADQFAQGIPVSRGNLRSGDLVFFSTYAPGATHVGIYIGGGMFINAEDAGLMITSLSNSYWSPRYIGAKRYFNS